MSLAHAEPEPEMTPAKIVDLKSIFEQQREAGLRGGPPSYAERRRDLDKLLHLVMSNRDEVARAIAGDFGARSAHETLLGEIIPSISAIKHMRRHLKGWMKPARVGVGLELLPGRARLIRQPLGVVGVISPWNYPFHLALVPLAAALAAGNRVMVKPSEHTPRLSDLLARLLGRAFAPSQVAVAIGGPSVGEAFGRLPFDRLIYTGSTQVGRHIMRAAADNLTPVTLELGGKSPVVVADDADLPKAVASIMFGKLLNAGQTCIAPDYVLVPPALKDEFARLAAAAIAKMYPRLEANPDFTSIVNERHYLRLKSYVDEARGAGAKVVEVNPANEPLDPAHRKMAPTLVIDPADDLMVMQEEIFGPILPIRTYESLDQAIDYINRRPRPLALYFFGRDTAKRDRVLARTTSGGASVNETLMHFMVENLPFGGVGPSGMGAYHGKAGFDTFSHRKGVFLQSRINGTFLLRPPFGKIADFMLKFLLNR